MADHRARYKNAGRDAKELRRRREENSILLRKQKRDDVLSKKRTLAPVDTDTEVEDGFESKLDTNQTDITITQEMVDGILQTSDMQLILESALRIRKILSKEPQPPFDDVIRTGIMPRLVELLSLDINPTIQFEVAWILTNISSGTSEQTRAVVEAGAVPKLVRLLNSPDIKVIEQAIWALANIVGDGFEFRDLVISFGFVPLLLSLIKPEKNIGFLRTATWVIVNLVRLRDPPANMQVVKQLIPTLTQLIQIDDIMVLIDSTWAISYIAELGPDYSQLTINSGLISKLTPLINHQEAKIQAAAIRTLGCVATGNDEQTQAVIDAQAIAHLYRLLRETNGKVIREALWFISNITAGSHRQIQAVIDGNLLPSIIHYLSVGDYTQQKEASWIIFNLCVSGNKEQLQCLIRENVIPPLCDLLGLKDISIVRNVIETLTCLLATCDDEEDKNVRYLIESCGGLDKIESLQSSENQEIYQYAYSIIDKYFSE